MASRKRSRYSESLDGVLSSVLPKYDLLFYVMACTWYYDHLIRDQVSGEISTLVLIWLMLQGSSWNQPMGKVATLIQGLLKLAALLLSHKDIE